MGVVYKARQVELIFTTRDSAGLVNANCPPAACANGGWLNHNSTSDGM